MCARFQGFQENSGICTGCAGAKHKNNLKGGWGGPSGGVPRRARGLGGGGMARVGSAFL